MKIRKFAAIDIGSNAIRLLIHNILEEEDHPPQFKKSAIIRVPVRLGADVFSKGKINKANKKRIIDTMRAFQLLMKVHGVEKYMACATSAMREAKNGHKIAAITQKKTGVNINVIEGKKEAEIIAATDLDRLIEKDKNYLYIDVGGGSTEFTIFSEGKTVTSQSFKIGTVRLLNKTVDSHIWEAIEKWVKINTQQYTQLSIIASGGNINKLFKMSGVPIGTPLSEHWLASQYRYLQEITYEERISLLGLNPDRADVIVPATRIYLSATQWSGAKEIHVPKIGLADGIIKLLYHQEK